MTCLFWSLEKPQLCLYLLCESCSTQGWRCRAGYRPALTPHRLTRPEGLSHRNFLPRLRGAWLTLLPPAWWPQIGVPAALQGKSFLLSEVLGCPFQKGPKERATQYPHAPRLLGVATGLPALPTDPRAWRCWGLRATPGLQAVAGGAQVRTFVPRSQPSPSMSGWCPTPAAWPPGLGHSRGFCQ